MKPVGADAVWDAWRAARSEKPDLEPAEFVAGYARERGLDPAEVRDALAMLLALEEAAPLPSLFGVLQGEAEDGRRFAGFRLVRELGEGSTGIVFEALDEREGQDSRPVALKILNPLLGAARARREVIEREAAIVSRLDHPGIVRVVDSGVERGYAWIATELVEGRPIDEWIDMRLDPGRRRAMALDVGLQVCAALAHAHARGLVHRDLKPANLMRDDAGRVKVLDFGLARVDGAAFAVSRTGEAVGTPLYMPPEQLRGERGVDARADVYSLGLVLLELATGRRLTLGAGALRTLDRIASGRVRLPRRAYDGLPAALAGVLSRCLEPHRDDRYSGVEALGADLAALREGRPPRLRRIGRAGRARRFARRHPARMAAGVALALLLAAAGLWVRSLAQRTSVSISAWPTDALVAIDAEPVGERAPRTAELSPGRHVARVRSRIAGVVRQFEHPFEVPVRGRLHLALPVGPAYAPPDPLVLAPSDSDLVYVQLLARPVDLRDHHAPFPIELEVDGQARELGDGLLALGLAPGAHRLRLSATGFRPRELTLELDRGLLRVPQVPLDLEGSPWHTVAVSGPLDPTLEELSLENLALRWESVQQDRFSEALVHRVGLATIDPARSGTVTFSLSLPFAAERVELLSIAEPELLSGDRDALLVEVGPALDRLVPVLDFAAPLLRPELSPGALPASLGDWQRALDEAWAAARAEGRDSSRVHVRWSVLGAKVLALRSNALARRLADGRALWDPAMALRALRPGSAAVARDADLAGAVRVDGAARQVVDLDAPGATRALDGGAVSPRIARGQWGLAGGRDCDGSEGEELLLWWRVDGGTRLELRAGLAGGLVWSRTEADFVADAALVHDVDGDGSADVLLGAPRSGPGGDLRGWIGLRSGRTGELLQRREGLRGETLGEQVAALGVAGAAGGTMAVAASFEYPSGGWGHARVLRLPTLEDVHLWRGRGQADHFGDRVVVPGDVDGDAVPDVVVAACDGDGPFWDSGVVSCFSGESGAELWSVGGRRSFDKLGRSLAPAGDIDGDGRGDLLTHSRSLGAHVLCGATGRVLRIYVEPADVEMVQDCGVDLDGDGRPEHALERSSASHRHVVVHAASDGAALLELRSSEPIALGPGPVLGGDGSARRMLVVGLVARAGGGASALLLPLD